MASLAYQLPTELHLQCLRAADPTTRVRASQVSRSWRTVALSDSKLWDSFSCSMFLDERHQDAMFDKLQTMVLRSRSSPFSLRIPFRYIGGRDSVYRNRVLAMQRLDVRRLVLYDGPGHIFSSLNLDQWPLPRLTFLTIVEPNFTAYKFFSTSTDMMGTFSARSLLNLQTLRADKLRFFTESDTFTKLQHLTCSVSERDYQQLFACCPNLVHLQLNDLADELSLPVVSLPVSLHTVVLCPFPRGALDICVLLCDWALERLPRLVIHDVFFLHGVLPLFLASHPHRVELRLNSDDNELELTTLPPDGVPVLSWTIRPSPQWTSKFLAGLDTCDCARLTSMSVALEQLASLFAAQLSVPGLECLEFRLIGIPRWGAFQAGDYFHIRAPRLQSVVFRMDGDADIRMAHIECVLSILSVSFRALVVYDAELLESITLYAPLLRFKEIDLGDFIRFSKVYKFCQTA